MYTRINNKGQALVMFVLVLPILLILLSLVINLGLLYIEKRNLNGNIEHALNYYLDNLYDFDIETKTKKFIEKNVQDIKEINIKESIDYVEINVTKDNRLHSVIPLDKEINVTYRINKSNKKITKGD